MSIGLIIRIIEKRRKSINFRGLTMVKTGEVILHQAQSCYTPYSLLLYLSF